ncbi:hypothetical protein K504DRAFT_457629 [Pleomassaria siparia CBS 279.74]|uniref:Uncharacterized protein n=1 Tax=Pleomassaria siparia CBS 279.74 TaxID=1314801 RepID=A0A6G1KRE7_9PLEO|nr:hypothetical protein K504DRAFT_457629 [Pleomassaria siparia CBS 279.74]
MRVLSSAIYPKAGQGLATTVSDTSFLALVTMFDPRRFAWFSLAVASLAIAGLGNCTNANPRLRMNSASKI